ncbi:MAG: hypothetical protein ABJE95_32665, partial [Byssovorax sp.]
PPPPSARAALPVAPPPPPIARAPLPVVPPPPPPPTARASAPSDAFATPISSHDMTMEIGDETTTQPTLPFSFTATPRLAPPAPPPRASEPDNPFESTMTMSGDEANQAIAAVQVLPFAPAPMARSVIPVTAIREPSYSLDETSILEDEPEETTVPMAQAFRRARPVARPSQGIPGAPWSGVPAAPVPRPQPELDESTRAIRRDETLARLGVAPKAEEAPPAAVAAPSVPAPTLPIVPAAPAMPPTREPSPSWSWGSTADAPKVEMPPPKPPRAPPTPAVKNSIYKSFTKKK